MRLAVLLAAVVVLTALASPLAASQTASQTAFDSTVTIDVDMRSDGDARLRVWTAYPLNSSADRAAFDRLAADFSAGSVGFQIDVFRDAAAAASDRTGRSMEITDVNRVKEIRNESGNATGVLSLEFTWTNFAEQSGDRIVLDSGWLTHLEADMRLRVDPPPGYEPQDVPATFKDGKAVWEGPYTFEDRGPELVFESGIDPPTSSTPTTSTTDPGPGNGFQGQFQLVLAVLATVLVGGFLAYVWTRREESEDETADGPGDDAEPPAGGSSGTADPPTTASGVADDAPSAGDDATTDSPPGEGEGAAGDVDEPTDDAEAVDDEPDIDEDLLSDEERVERMVRANGGRMKQANIVKETGWSNAKVSQLLSGMDEAERIDKLRLGRENLIILSDGEDDDEAF